MSSNVEFELKLVGPPNDIDALRNLDFVRRAIRGAGEWAQLRTTYFDSEERRLAKRGLSLRIREEAGMAVLTAKLEEAGTSSIKRREYERVVDSGARVFVTGIAEIDEIIGEDVSDLAPIARTQTNRWSAIVSDLGAVVELSSETGSAESFTPERRAAAIAEIEIELLKGPPGALFDWARRLVLVSEGRLRPSVETKLARAMRAGASPQFGKAPRAALSRSARVGDILGAALAPIAVRIVETSAEVVAAHDREAARQLRVALRRLRSLERLFRKEIGGDTLKKLAADARSCARLVGAARDLENFSARNLHRADASAELVARAQSKAAAAWSAAAGALGDRSFGVFLIDLLEAAMTESWRASWAVDLRGQARPYTDKKLARRKERLEDAVRDADFKDPSSLHAVRIALKKLRYAAQFFRDFYDGDAVKPYFAAMADLQTELGDINDAVSAQAIANDMAQGLGPQSAKAAGFIAGYRCAEAALRADAAKEAWVRFSAMAPYWATTPESGES